jgi:hypothetical protein
MPEENEQPEVEPVPETSFAGLVGHPTEQSEQAMKFGVPGVDELKKVIEILHILNAIKTEDANGNGKPDWQDLIVIGTALVHEFSLFKSKVPTLSVIQVLPELQIFWSKISGLYAEAELLIGKDASEFLTQFPELAAHIPAHQDPPAN